MTTDTKSRAGRPKPSPLAGAVGRRIRALRKERGWSTRHLAGLLGITVEQVERYEQGGALPGVRMLLFLSQAFDVSVDTFVYADPQSPPVTDEGLLKRFRQVGMLGPEVRKAASDLLDIFLGLHDLLRSPRGKERAIPPRNAETPVLHLDQLAGFERHAAEGLLGVVMGLRRLVQERTPRRRRRERKSARRHGGSDGPH